MRRTATITTTQDRGNSHVDHFDRAFSRDRGVAAMMGRTHCASGVAAWLAGAALLAHLGHGPGPVSTAAGAVLCGAGALLPDIDHPGSTVTRVHPGTTVASWIIRRFVEHRGATHYLSTAVVTGVIVGAAVAVPPFGWWTIVAAGLVALTVAGAAPGRYALPASALSALAVATGRWWVGLAVGTGMAVHTLGDALTRDGSPLWGPWSRRRVKLLWLTTGSRAERWVVRPALIVAGLGSALWWMVAG